MPLGGGIVQRTEMPLSPENSELSGLMGGHRRASFFSAPKDGWLRGS